MSNKLLFEKSIDKLSVLFKFSGMNIKNDIITISDVFKYRSLYVLNFSIVLAASFISIFYTIDGLKNEKSFTELTGVTPCLAFTILAMIKSINHYLNEDYIKELLNLLKKLEVRENEREKSEEKKRIMDKEVGFLNTVINILYGLNCSMIVVFDMTPLIMIAVKYYRTNEVALLLPYLDVFTLVPYKIKYWVMGYVYQIWSECVALLYMGSADYLFFTCCVHLRIQFKLLQYDFEKFIPGKGERDTDGVIRDTFVELVKWHQDLIYSSNILEIIYSKSTLFNFLSSSIVICLTGFNVTVVNETVVIITFLTFLFMGLMQVFFLCFFADMMTSASAEVSTAVYNSRWYLARCDVGRQLLMVQTRAQEPCKLTASGFADVNLRAFMRVLSTSWSYFALLQTLYGG